MKTNIRQIIYGGLALISVLTTTSCSDELNALPSQSKVDGNLVVDQKSAIAALNGIYYKYAMCGTDNYSVKSTKCSAVYEIYPANLAGANVYYQGAYMFETHDASTMTQYGTYLWTSFYGTLNAANAVIDQITDAPDSYFYGNKKNEILGEVRCMRALSIYNILRFFGWSWDVNSPYGVIIRTEKSTATNLQVGRNSVGDTYKQILSDLEFAITNAPENNDNYYVSQWFAKGLKARILMMRGQEGDYSEAASICNDIIANGPYRLEENYQDIFHTQGLKSSEVIFGIQPKADQTNVYEAYYYRGNPQYYPSDNMLGLYDDDPRLEQMYKSVESETIGWNDDGTYYLYTTTQYVICKHLDPDLLTYNDTEETQYQMRLSEIYLLEAEALARTGNTAEAGELLKTVMSKSGLTDFTAVDAATSSEEMLRQIFREGIKNLSFECGLEHNMMLRFPENITLEFNPAYKEKQYNVFPIPADEFKYNGALNTTDQNPGYTTT